MRLLFILIVAVELVVATASSAQEVSGSAWELLPSRSSATCCNGSAHDGASVIVMDGQITD
jgi:hypothetical protein